MEPTVMTEQKLINAYIDPHNAERAMVQIRAAAGDDAWRIVNIVWLGQATDAKNVSPGVNDPRRLEGEPALVVLERTVSVTGEGKRRFAAAELA